MERLRYGFLGSPPFATPVLARLLDAERVPELVVTQPPRPQGRGRGVATSPVVELATSRGVEVRTPESVKDERLRTELRALDLDVLLVASYGELLDQEFLDLPKLCCLNVHGSLLPRWRGASPVQAAIVAGDRTTGVSVQRVVRKLDAGDVMLRVPCEIEPDETGGSLFDKLALLGGEAAVTALSIVESGRAVFEPQDEARVTHCRKLTKESGRLDFARPASELERLVRAMDPWPGAATELRGERFVVWRATVAGSSALTDAPGTVRIDDGRLFVATGAGELELLEVQAAGKKRMAARAWLLGARLESGEILGRSAD
ncbi:MAG: methionyl-tRNA formyltransferase [Planctomycetota bacterium]